MRLLNRYDLIEHYDAGYFKSEATVLFCDLDYQGEGCPIEISLCKIIDYEEKKQKSHVERGHYGANVELPTIKVEANSVMHKITSQPLGVCWQGDIETVLKIAEERGDTDKNNCHLRNFREGLKLIADFRRSIAVAEAAERRHLIKMNNMPNLLFS